jgi:hypothetical protein
MCVALVLCLPLCSQASVLVQNGDFEVPALGGGWGYLCGGTPQLSAEQLAAATWTATGQVGLGADGLPFGVPAGSTGQFAFLQSDANTPAWATSTLSQTLSGFDVGSSYKVNFKDALLDYNSASDLSVYLDYGLSTQKLLYSTTSVAQGAWTSVTTSQFQAAKDSYVLSFVSVDGGALSGASVICVDNVGVSPVPEPNTLILTWAGLLGLAAYAWRKHK